MIVYDFCSGAGGASKGMADLGLDPIGFDWWEPACRTHHAAGFRTVRADLTTYALRPGADLMWASPPCQPFSAGGDHEGEDDERDLIPAWLHALEAVRPAVAVMENVRGLTYIKHADYLTRMLRTVHRLGYRFDWRVLDCADYGVPQNRERFILIARRDDGPLAWPAITHSEGGGLFTAPWVTMAEALGWGLTERPYPTVSVGTKAGGPDSAFVGGSGARRILNTGRDWKPGGTRDTAQQRDDDRPSPAVSTKPGGAHNRPRDADHEPAPALAFGKDFASWCWTRPATTLAADPRIFPPGSHQANDGRDNTKAIPRSAAADTIRVETWEAGVLQSFPPDYPWQGSRTSIAQQIGNAVPPLLARAIIGALLAE